MTIKLLPSMKVEIEKRDLHRALACLIGAVIAIIIIIVILIKGRGSLIPKEAKKDSAIVTWQPAYDIIDSFDTGDSSMIVLPHYNIARTGTLSSPMKQPAFYMFSRIETLNDSQILITIVK